jgi:hypothetical protein
MSSVPEDMEAPTWSEDCESMKALFTYGTESFHL